MSPKKKKRPATKRVPAKKSKPLKSKVDKKKAPPVTEADGSRGFTVSLAGVHSLQAFKDKVRGVMSAIKPGYKDTLTQEEWVKKWKKFRAKFDEAEEKRKRGEITPEPPKEYKTIDDRYPGISEDVRYFEEMVLPACTHCGSADTASVQVGIIGRTIYISGKTKKFKLVPNMKDKLGKYFCNTCKKYFDE